jgi:hypothetical protein
MVDKGIIDGDGAVVAVACGGVLLEQFQASLVECLDIPGFVVEKAIAAGLVGSAGELGVDAGDGLACGDVQSGEVFGKVPTLRFVGEEIAEVSESFLDHLGEVNDASHGEDPCRRGTSPTVYKHPQQGPESLSFANRQIQQVLDRSSIW